MDSTQEHYSDLKPVSVSLSVSDTRDSVPTNLDPRMTLPNELEESLSLACWAKLFLAPRALAHPEQRKFGERLPKNLVVEHLCRS
eukprot:6219428-Amphidinium_carterae.1